MCDFGYKVIKWHCSLLPDSSLVSLSLGEVSFHIVRTVMYPLRESIM